LAAVEPHDRRSCRERKRRAPRKRQAPTVIESYVDIVTLQRQSGWRWIDEIAELIAKTQRQVARELAPERDPRRVAADIARLDELTRGTAVRQRLIEERARERHRRAPAQLLFEARLGRRQHGLTLEYGEVEVRWDRRAEIGLAEAREQAQLVVRLER